MALPAITPTGAASLEASNVSSHVTIPTTGTPTQVVVTNFGPSAAFVALGDNTVVATVAGGFAILPNSVVVLGIAAGVTDLAAITTHDTAALHINAGT